MNRIISPLLAMLVVAAGSAVSFAQVAPTTGPVVATAAPRVEIFSFTPVSSQPAQTDWIGRGIQESLQSEVSRTGATLVIPIHTPAATDDAVTVARQNKADLAVIGTYQVVGDDVRVNAHLMDAATNAAVGSFEATGPQKSLFNLEDALGEQLRRLLPQAAAPQQVSAQAQVTQPAPVVVYQVPQQTYSEPSPTVNNYYDSSPNSGYYYPDTYYGYVSPFPFYYGGIGVYGGHYYHGGHESGRGPVFHGGAFGGRSGGFGIHGGLGARGGFGGGFGGGRGGRR